VWHFGLATGCRRGVWARDLGVYAGSVPAGEERERGVPALEALDVARRAAQAGGEVLIRGLGRDKEVRGSRTSIVTWADGESQATIERLVLEAYPSHRVLGEEGRAGSLTSPNLWIVDPLDGTSNYAHDFPFYNVSVAYAEHGQVLAGAVYDPLRQELFCAARGHGATLNGQPLRVSGVHDPARAFVFSGFQSDDPAVVSLAVRRLERLANTLRAVRIPGSPALSLCYVAAGRAEGFCHSAIHSWDVAAGAIVVQEAGGTVTSYDAVPLDIDIESASSILASNGALHTELLALLRV